MFKKSSVIIFILVTALAVAHILTQQEETLSESVLRLHVIANSDDPKDQALKLKVKDAIVEMMRSEFKETDNVDEACRLAAQNIYRIKKVAEAEIAEQGYDYPVTVYMGECEFPTKSYGNIVFPQGKYQAVKVIIGEGEGKNWWCVLFPPLCLVSTSDKGLSLDSPEEAQISLKCLELIPKGVRFGFLNKEN